MRVYTPVYSAAALEALLSSRKQRRARARIAIERWCRRPSVSGDYGVRDLTGRDWAVNLIEGVVITYWIDHAVCEVKIGLIEWVD